MMQHLIDPVPNICEVRPDLPPGMDAIITNSMAKAPGERYAHAGELTDTLDSLASIDSVMPAKAVKADAREGVEVAAAVLLDEAAAQVEIESGEVEATIPDSAEMRAQRSAAAAPTPPPAPELVAKADEEVKASRRKWIIAFR